MVTEQESIAYHEAGHAVVAHKLGVKVRSVTIVPAQGCLGECEHRSMLFDGGLFERENVERAIQINLAGPLAQKRFHRRSYRRFHGSRDYYRASGLARYLAGSDEREFLKDQELLTETLIERWWNEIARIASARLQYDHLSGFEIETELEFDVDQSGLSNELTWAELELAMPVDLDDEHLQEATPQDLF